MPETIRPVRPHSVRAPRVPFDLEVESRTLGTEPGYHLSTVDVSRSGLLLTWERGSKIPFLENTILELTIDPQGHLLKGPVTCLGKVVRREDEAGGEGRSRSRLGVQIIQIDNSDLRAWEGCLHELEQTLGIEPAARVMQKAS